jgi:hypothetical protein
VLRGGAGAAEVEGHHPSWNRVTPGAAGFLTLSQVLVRPDR